ncbi:hypothetical protein DBR45_11130 [Pseudomonas sp. HMWF031]|nr:hypothetical protein DBR45_11130 [Pseudomonas sp. HMWF031]
MSRYAVFAANRSFSVGASLLAMDVNDNAYCLTQRVVIEIIAIELAPTQVGGGRRSAGTR